jgi:hypothetical protein
MIPRHPASIGLAFLISTLAMAGTASADDTAWSPWTSNNTPPPAQSDRHSTAPAVYDMAPVVARAAVADAQYDRAVADIAGITAGLRRQFENSSEYLSAQHELDAAKLAYTDASAPVLDALLRDPSYHKLIEQRTQLEIALSDPGLNSDQRLDLATRKMQIATLASNMEMDALNNDPAAHDARIRLIAAQQTFADLKSNFETSLDAQPDLIAARRNLENARINSIGANAYLDGAWVTRADTMDAIQAQYGQNQNQNPNNGYGYGYGGYPYGWWGWGGSIVVVQNSPRNCHFHTPISISGGRK